MKNPFRIAAWVGLGVIVMSVILLLVNPTSAEALPPGFFTPLIALEFARSSADINLIFGAAGSAAQQMLVDALTRGNQLDFIYMLLYGAFLGTFGLAVAHSGSKLGFLAMALALVALLADGLENITLAMLMDQLGTGDLGELLARLHLVTWIKWGSLAFAFLALMPFLAGAGRLGQFISAVAGLPFVLGLFAYFQPGLLNELFALSVAFIFLLLIVFAWVYRPGSAPTHAAFS